MKIGTSSSDNLSSSYKSNNFEGRQPRSNESQYSRKNGSGKRRELEEKGTGFFKKDQGERSLQSESEGPERKCKSSPRQQGAKRKFSVKSNDLPNFSKRNRRDETVMPSTSGYNLQPRIGAKVEFRPANEKTQQVRSRGSRAKQQYRPYTEEQRRSSRSGQQQHCQERKGEANSNRSLSLKVLGGDVNFKS
ncbi:uncharacterized protein TNCV_2950101 [Trichonephila clavipes]|nr:uncharacterized protein TNCV_2950101 [Trichonephila clavipes]